MLYLASGVLLVGSSKNQLGDLRKKTGDIEYRISSRAVFGCLCKLRIYFEKDLKETSTGCDFYTIMALIQVSIL